MNNSCFDTEADDDDADADADDDDDDDDDADDDDEGTPKMPAKNRAQMAKNDPLIPADLNHILRRCSTNFLIKKKF
jgi:hypothetical protein